MLQLTQTEKTTIYTTIRMCVYFALLILAAVGVWKLARVLGVDTFDENGIVENVQCGILIVTATLFAVIGCCHKSMRMAVMCLVGLCILGLCREQDAWFDAHLPVLSWRIGYFFPALMAIYGLWHFKTFKKEVIELLRTPAVSLMFCAMVMVIPCAQCIGHRPLIAAVMVDDNSGAVFAIRRMIEETGELLGYLLIFLAAIELIFNLKKSSNTSV